MSLLPGCALLVEILCGSKDVVGVFLYGVNRGHDAILCALPVKKRNAKPQRLLTPKPAKKQTAKKYKNPRKRRMPALFLLSFSYFQRKDQHESNHRT